MRSTITRIAVSLVAAAAMTTGMAAFAATPAMAAPCGLSYKTEGLPAGPLKIVYYDIKNCHGSSVKRNLDISGTTDGQCHEIGAGETVRSERVIAGWASVHGMKPC